ncbi:Two-component sensor histidine kinase [Methanophagales archaeon]|nr:Two-component sensor histidine kinase [Methanophagales archaeon]
MAVEMIGEAIEILLVEDNPGDVRLTQEALRDGKVHNNLHVAWDGVEAILSESRNRINAMALIHSQLYEGGDLSAIIMKGFMNNLLVQLLQVHSVPETKISPVVHAVDCSLPISAAVPVGLIANELLTNAFKHAFANRKEGKIEVSLGASGKGNIGLTISDDGVGLPEGFDINASKTLGLRVVKILAEEQLDGKLEVDSDKGTTFKVEFEMAKR